MIRFEHIGFSYPHGKTVLRDVSFGLDKGECVCLLGPNGTGKTTLLKCLLAHLHPQNGCVTLDGRALRQIPARERARHIAYVAQATQLAFPYSVEEVILMGRVAHMRLGAVPSCGDRHLAQEVMERLGISDMADKNFQALSGGERQMVLFGRALAQQAEYLILDEPTAALDYSNQVRVLQIIRHLAREGYGILMTTHFPDHAFLACSRAVLLRDGCVLEDGPPARAVTSENLTRLYHVPVCVTKTVLKNTQAETVQQVCVPLLNDEGEGT
ncbi:ABC transporter ATP-binding protein [Anaerotruncus colihominis]|uniref:ABC transporter ATP-binding protein n=1 Tax=Anaerotruncus colihominis TaxID=169435 RepID=UPI002673D318|nr:ABC transporter ATP-binding protein [Anaerotruncus colihominis]